MAPAPIRCAVLVPAPAPYREPLFRALGAHDRLELRVIYSSPRQTSWDQPAQWFGGERPYDAVYLRAYEVPRRGRTPILWPRGVERSVSRFDPQVVVSSEFGPGTLRALSWCRRHRRPLVILTEVTREVQASLPAPQRAVHRWLAPRAQGFVAVSARARDRLLGLGVSSDAIELSLQSADLAPIRAAVAQGPPRSSRSLVRLLTVGRLVPDKNFGRLLEACASAGIPAELHIHGVGPLERELRDAAGRLGVRAVFRGFSTSAEMARAYAGADLFTLLSTFEPFGVAVREAVAAGLPLLCSSRVGAVDDLVFEGRNGLLVDPEDVGAIAGALRRLCDDDALRLKLANGSRVVDAEHDLARDVEAFAAAIVRAAGGG